MLKGLPQIRDSITSRGQGGGEGQPELSINSGEIALIHFLTDIPDIIEASYHLVPITLPGGGTFKAEKLCRQDVGETCPFCSHTAEDIRHRTRRWYAWVFVYGILTPQIIQGADTVVRGVRTLYVQKLGEIAILRKGEGNNKYLIQQLLTNGERYGTLRDRVYEWERTGSTRNDTTYMLTPTPDLSAPPDAKVPSLEEIISKEMNLKNYPARASKGGQPTGDKKDAVKPNTPSSQLLSLLQGGVKKPAV